MSTSKPISPLLQTVLRPNQTSKARYICQPCLLSNHHLQQTQRRSAHKSASSSRTPVPSPTPFVPDVATFLTLIGRDLSAQVSKFPTWESLFTQTSAQLRTAGIEPARTRRYLLRWREKFRNGDYGVGGDLQHVENGTAELRVIDVPSVSAVAAATASNTSTTTKSKTKPQSQHPADPKPAEYFSTTHTPGQTKLVLNVPAGVTSYQQLLKAGQTSLDLKKPKDYKLKDGMIIAGPYALPASGGRGDVATVKVQPGMWEHKRGQKVFGGERRRAETLHKMGVAEHRKAIGTAR